eukprot:4615636-Ditylum_brightwellii.AAC.1
MLVELRKEGIKEAEDLAKFDKDTWKQVTENLKHPGGWMKNLDKDTNKNSTPPQTLYTFRAKLQKRLLEASKLMRAIALTTRLASVHKYDLPHGEESYLIEDDLVAQASHMHHLNHEDNAAVYYCLEEAVRALSMPQLSSHTS